MSTPGGARQEVAGKMTVGRSVGQAGGRAAGWRGKRRTDARRQTSGVTAPTVGSTWPAALEDGYYLPSAAASPRWSEGRGSPEDGVCWRKKGGLREEGGSERTRIACVVNAGLPSRVRRLSDGRSA
jgi:hypothetical protein